MVEVVSRLLYLALPVDHGHAHSEAQGTHDFPASTDLRAWIARLQVQQISVLRHEPIGVPIQRTDQEDFVVRIDRRHRHWGRISCRSRWEHAALEPPPTADSGCAPNRLGARPDHRARVPGELDAPAGGVVRADCSEGVAGSRNVVGRAGCAPAQRSLFRGGVTDRLPTGWTQSGARRGAETRAGP